MIYKKRICLVNNLLSSNTTIVDIVFIVPQTIIFCPHDTHTSAYGTVRQSLSLLVESKAVKRSWSQSLTKIKYYVSESIYYYYTTHVNSVVYG